MKHLKYLSYVLRHKYYVMIECFKYKLYWRGLKHDISKFLPSEWFPYVNHFCGKDNRKLFDFAWFRHQNRNDHHWQWWILREDSGSTKAIEMKRNAVMEMLCDWCGASKAQGNGGWRNVRKWYIKNSPMMILNNETRKFIEQFLYSCGE